MGKPESTGEGPVGTGRDRGWQRELKVEDAEGCQIRMSFGDFINTDGKVMPP